jgi:flagellar biosynthesis chaperone FliJ
VKGLNTLVRIAQSRVDNERRLVSEIEAQRDALVGEIERLGKSMRYERDHAAASLEAGVTFSGFVGATLERREQLGMALEQVETRLDSATQELRLAYGELKKFEITVDQRIAVMRAEQNAREQLVDNEIGLTMHRRRRNSGG